MASGTPKNVLMISFDDAVAVWKYKAVFGQALQTPNLDRICAQSTAFHSAYAQAPICSPSRASFMSGLAPHQSGIIRSKKEYFDMIPPEELWPYQLNKAGYFCSSGGKVAQGYPPLDEDIHEILFDDERKTFRKDWRIPPHISKSYGGMNGGWAAVNEADDNRFYDYQSASSFEAFIKDYDGMQPFYREVGFYGPHGPWITPARYKEMYHVPAFSKPKAWAVPFPESDFAARCVPKNFRLSAHRKWKQSVRNYFSALTHVDHHLGRVWDALKASPHGQDTLVVIVSDHGLHLGDRDRFAKGTLYEQVVNVPLVIHDPDQPVQQVVTDPVALLDVGPTILDYLGLPPLEGRVGRSLLPQMHWARKPERAVPSFFKEGAAVRQGRYRYINNGDGSTELYDLAEDWWQIKPLGEAHEAHGRMRDVFERTCAEYGMAA